jgi:chromosome segregation ATPase
MAKTRPRPSNAGSANQQTTHPTRKRRASNISSQRNPAPRAKRQRSDTEQLDAENEAGQHVDEEEQDFDYEQNKRTHNDKQERGSPMEAVPSSPPVQYQSTTLTQQVVETTIQSTPVVPPPTKRGRGRQSMPARLETLTSDVEVHQFTPFAETIDARRKRRLSRNHMSEEQHAYTDRLHELQKQLKAANERIEEVEIGREADRIMGTGNILDDEKDKMIADLRREKAKLEKDLAEHESCNPQEDGGHIDNDNMEMEDHDLALLNENVAAHTTNGEDLATTTPHSHRADHASCKAVINGYQQRLIVSEVAIAKLTAEAEGIRIQMQNLGFTTEDNYVLSIVAAVHDAFSNARTELANLDLLPEQDLDDGDILRLMVGLLRGFQQQMANLEVRETELNNEVSRLVESIDSKDVMKDALDRENDSLLRDKVELEDELKDSQEETAFQKEELEKAVEQFKEDLSALKTEHDEQLSHMLEELNHANYVWEEVEAEKDDEIAKLKNQLEEALAADEAAGEQLEAAGINTDVLREGIAQLGRERDAQDRQRVLAEQNLDEAQETISRLEPELAEANRKVGDLELEKNRLKLDIFNHQTQKENAIAARDKAVEDHKATIAKLQEGHQISLEHEVSLRRTTIENMDQIIAEEREAGEKLGRQADSLEQEKQQLEGRLQSADSRNDELDEENHQLRTNVAELEAKVRALDTSIEEHEGTIEQHEATIFALNAAIEEHKATIEQYAATILEHENTIRLHEGTIRDRNATIHGHEATIQEYTEKIDKLTTDVNDKNGEIEDLQDDLRQRNKDYEQVKSDLAVALTKLAQHATQTSQDFEHLTQRVSQRGMAITLHEGEIYLGKEAEELDEEFEAEELDEDTAEDEDVDMAVTETEAVIVDTTTVQVTPTTKRIQQDRYMLRNGKEQRDSGVGMMSDDGHAMF